MSGQWEVVGKKNKPVKNTLKDAKKNKIVQNGPKVEEVCEYLDAFIMLYFYRFFFVLF